MNVPRIPTETFKLKRDFRRKNRNAVKRFPIYMMFIMNLHGHYKHNDKDIAVLAIVNIN